MDKVPYSTVVGYRFPNTHNRTSFPTPSYSEARAPDTLDGASLQGMKTCFESPNSHALLLLCFSIGNRASISALWTDAVPGRSPGAMVR